MCTQALSTNHAKAEIKYHSMPGNHHQPSTCLSCEFKVPVGSSVSVSQSSTPGSSRSSSTTLSGGSDGRGAEDGVEGSIITPSCVKTDIKPGMVCVSSHYPASRSRSTAIRQTCLRMLSSEHTFNDSTDSTPMLFSDPSIGSAIILVFMVQDESSRGNVRRYGITCICEDERLLVESWNIIVPQIEKLSKSIQKRATLQTQKQHNITSSSYSGGPERYLRKRDAIQPPKSLATIVNDDELFVEIHSRFTKILAELQYATV